MPYGFALRVVLTPRDVGTRVVVRRTLPDGRLGDVLGQLVAWTGGILTIRTRTGALVQVDEATVVAGKPVPPPPRLTLRGSPGAAGSERPLAEVAADGWPGIERAELGGWRLQAAAGWSARANSVVPLSIPERPVPERPLDDALAVVRDWYAARGLVARFQVDLADPLDRELERRGWRRRDPEEEVLVQTAPAAALLDAAGPLAPAVAVHGEPTEGWLRLYRRAFQAPAVARAVLTSPAGAVVFAAVEEDGRVLAGARGVVLH
ncbi:MAG: GNAT family N-acetyltransferase, partial [Actinomycetota bacterium]|nr:GNAT family N-acetyltransferase [Actinomycetota bacterium]